MVCTAPRGEKILIEIAEQFEVHPTQVIEWKKQLLERASDVFDGGGTAGKVEAGPVSTVLHAKIGQQALEVNFLTGALTEVECLSTKKPWLTGSMTCR